MEQCKRTTEIAAEVKALLQTRDAYQDILARFTDPTLSRVTKARLADTCSKIQALLWVLGYVDKINFDKLSEPDEANLEDVIKLFEAA